MELRKVPATRRSEHGKSAVRRLRKQGRIPAVAYGKNLKAQPLEVAPKDLTDVLASQLGRNTVIELAIDAEDTLTVLLNDFQYDPLSRSLLHADFLQIDIHQPVDVDVPFELTGKAAGVVLGGVLRQVFRKLPVRCLPAQIPVKIEYDVTALELGQHVAVQDLPLPEGVTVRLDPARTVAGVVTEAKAPEAEEAAAPGAVPGAPVEGAPTAEAAESGKT